MRKMSRYYFLALLCVLCSAKNEISSNFWYEESCAVAKGYCVLSSECPHAVTKDEEALCPNQRSKGAICCKNFPIEDVNCNQMHNECSERCHSDLDLGRKGCPKDQTCCLLI